MVDRPCSSAFTTVSCVWYSGAHVLSFSLLPPFKRFSSCLRWFVSSLGPWCGMTGAPSSAYPYARWHPPSGQHQPQQQQQQQQPGHGMGWGGQQQQQQGPPSYQQHHVRFSRAWFLRGGERQPLFVFFCLTKIDSCNAETLMAPLDDTLIFSRA